MTPPALSPSLFYHIYNRGNNRENIFREKRNYQYYMQLYEKYITPVAETYAYCLLRNHFHLLVRTRSEDEIQVFRDAANRKISSPSMEFGKLFNAYAKAFNKTYQRTGSLFQKPFGRVLVKSNAHLFHLVRYIHRNPQKHGFVDDFSEWPYSSYQVSLSDKPTRIQRHDVLEWFGDRSGFIELHHTSF